MSYTKSSDGGPRSDERLVQPPMHWTNWLWMAPCAIALSPIGTIVFTKCLGLDFAGCLKLIGAQVLAFAFLYALSNGGE